MTPPPGAMILLLAVGCAHHPAALSSSEGPIHGSSYRVDVSEDGRHFTVRGWQDLDGDGVPAEWLATDNENAHRVTGDGVR